MFCRVHVSLPEFTQTCEIETRQLVQAMSCQPSHSSACFCASHITLHCFKVSSCSLASFANIQQCAHVASSSTMFACENDKFLRCHQTWMPGKFPSTSGHVNGNIIEVNGGSQVSNITVSSHPLLDPLVALLVQHSAQVLSRGRWWSGGRWSIVRDALTAAFVLFLWDPQLAVHINIHINISIYLSIYPIQFYSILFYLIWSDLILFYLSYLSIDLSIDLSIGLSIYLSIDLSIYLPT